MADPIRFLTDWPGFHGRRVTPSYTAGQIIKQDPLQQAVRLIAYHELRVWFEPCWHDARYLARRFPHCTICSIPVESDTFNLHRTPGWRPRRITGIV
jgi:hypothetical protein